MSISLQRCHCQTFALISVYQPCHLPDFISLVSVYSPVTRQTLWHWFQFTAMPLVRRLFPWFQFAILTLVRLYLMVTVCISAACQTLFHWFQLAVLPLAIFDLPRFSLQSAYICTEIYNSESYHVVCP